MTAEEESLRDLLEDAEGMAANAPEEDKESANSLVRAVLRKSIFWSAARATRSV